MSFLVPSRAAPRRLAQPVSLRSLSVLAFVLVTLMAPGAFAQSVTLDNTSFEIVREEERSSGEFPFHINREDCFNADADDPTTIRLTPALSNYDDDWNVEVWLGNPGNDCTTQEMRQPTNGRCALLHRERARGEFVRNITLDVQDVVHGTLNPPGESVIGEGTASDCEEDVEDNVVFYVLLVADGGVVQGTPATWENTVVDLSAPPPPDTVSIAAGDGHLFAEWEIDTSSEDDDTQGFVIWCVPSGTTQTVDSTGLGGQGGSSSAGSGTSTCGQNVLAEGELPPDNDAYRCGEARGRSVRSGQAEVDGNGTQYAVAVSSKDQVQNDGRLSAIECATPQEVTTFFEQYRADGGRGGGGFCSWAPPRAGGWGLAFAGAIGGLLMMRRRRRA